MSIYDFKFDNVETFLRIWSCARPYITEEDKVAVCSQLLENFFLDESTLRFEAVDAGYNEILEVLRKRG